jgi:hypothetical protein
LKNGHSLDCFKPIRIQILELKIGLERCGINYSLQYLLLQFRFINPQATFPAHQLFLLLFPRFFFHPPTFKLIKRPQCYVDQHYLLNPFPIHQRPSSVPHFSFLHINKYIYIYILPALIQRLIFTITSFQLYDNRITVY